MNKKSKILFLVQLPPPVHGVSVVNKSLLESDLVSSQFKIESLPLVFVKNIKDIGRPSLLKIWYLLLTIFSLIKILISKKVDLVYFTISPTGFAFYRDIIFVFILKTFRKRLVYHLHGKGIRENAEKSKANNFLYKWMFKNTSVITLSKVLSLDIETVYRPKPYILNNGIKRVDIEEQINSELTTFVFLSNLNKSKGIKIFLDAINTTHKNGFRFKAKIIGNSSQDFSIEDLKKYVTANDLNSVVEILGPQYGNDKFAQLAMSDVLVFPTLNDCFPLSIIEAMQMKLSVISTPIGAIPEIIENGINGQILSENNKTTVSKAMINYINNPFLAKEYGLNNYNKFIQKYTQEKFEENFIKIINKILTNLR
ncbi:putative glycosyltransferase [Flavobacteriales bacterium ALC-1]|nr:putative glycosyltransferase [Flavobacteriales bacterium ALC-1]